MGRVGNGVQKLDLSRGCALDETTVIHEFMHAIGVHHYQKRPDRDEYISYNEEKDNNNHWKALDSSTYKTNYDEKSLMHYGPGLFQSFISKVCIYLGIKLMFYSNNAEIPFLSREALMRSILVDLSLYQEMIFSYSVECTIVKVRQLDFYKYDGFVVSYQ